MQFFRFELHYCLQFRHSFLECLIENDLQDSKVPHGHFSSLAIMDSGPYFFRRTGHISVFSCLHMNALTKSLSSYWKSSIGKKILVAVTGLILVLFLAGHLAGNLLVFVGPEAFNNYAELLHELLHGAGVWIARIVLLTALVVHVVATIALVRQNRVASPKYEYQATIQAPKSSLIMIWTGLTILAFVVYHLMHFTIAPKVGVDKAYQAATGETRNDAWQMVIDGFSNGFVVLFYVIAMSLLCSHISHGVGSMFQTLGFRSKKSSGLIRTISLGYAGLIWAGFVSIPVAIFLFNFGKSH